MLDALLSVGLGVLLAAALAAWSGDDVAASAAVALLYGVLVAGGLDGVRGRADGVVVRGSGAGHDQPEPDQNVREPFRPA